MIFSQLLESWFQDLGQFSLLNLHFVIQANLEFLIINLHPALPGEYPGTHALERAWADYEAGKISRTGIMVHRVILALDAGQPIVTESIDLEGLPDFQALRDVSRAVEHRILVEAVRRFSRESSSLD